MSTLLQYLNQSIILSGFNPDLRIQVSFVVVAIEVVFILALILSLVLKRYAKLF